VAIGGKIEPAIGVSCQGVTAVRIDGNNKTPSYFSGAIVFAQDETFNYESLYVNNILKVDGNNIVLSKYSNEPDHPDTVQWLTCTLFNYLKEEEENV
jgi:hypothetical protein